MAFFVSNIRQSFPNVFVHQIMIGNSADTDSKSSIFGSMEKQVAEVCLTLKTVKEVQNGFDAIGLSQGGQLLRAYVQMCDGPRVRRLITLGSQHGGISSISNLQERLKLPLLNLNPLNYIYSDYIQKRVLPAQYTRVPSKMTEYLEAKPYIGRINGELCDYKCDKDFGRDRMLALEKFVMYKFEKDSIVQPAESSHFALDSTSGVVPLTKTDMYANDWIGLKTLHTAGRLLMRIVPNAQHMEIRAGFVRDHLASELRTDDEETLMRCY